MAEQILLLVVGSIITLVTTLIILAVKRRHETRRYPTEVLFNKQTEYYDRIAQALPAVGAFAESVGDRAIPLAEWDSAKVANDRNRPVVELHELTERYSMYLPEKVLRAEWALFFECRRLSVCTAPSRAQSADDASHCTDLLYSFQNAVRESVGADKISEDLLKAFGAEKETRRQE